MPSIASTFSADFTKFTTAVDAAVLKLKSFEEGALKADAMVNRMGNRFSGTRVIQEAVAMEKAIADIGGAAMLTNSELIEAGQAAERALEKMGRMGQQASAGLLQMAADGKAAQAALERLADLKPAETFTQNIAKSNESLFSMSGLLKGLGPTIAGAFTVNAVIGLAKDIGAFASEIQNLHNETGVATDDLQALNYVAAGANLTIDEVTRSTEQLAKRLASGDESAAKAMDTLGIATSELEALDPVGQLKLIGTAADAINDPMQRNVLMMELFGKTGSRMTRIVTGDLGDLMDQAKTSGAVIDSELIAKADKFGTAISEAMIRAKAAIVTFVGEAIDLWNQLPWNREKDPWRLDPRAWGEALDQALGMRAATPPPAVGKPKAAAARDQIGSEKWLQDQARDLAAGEKKLTAETLANAKKAEKEAADLEAARQKRIHDQFGPKAITDDDLERSLFGMTSAERDKFTKDYEAYQTQTFRDLARIQASGPYVPGMKETKPTADDFPLPAFENKAKVADWIRQGKFQDALKPPAKESAGIFSSTFSDNLGKTLGPALISAFAGGGNIGKTLTSAVGESLSKSIFGKDGIGAGLMSSLTGKGGLLGGLMGSVAGMLPGIGSLLGPAISGVTKLFGKLFGGEGKETNKQRDQWIAANYGTSDNLRQLAVQAGVTDEALRRLFSVSKVKDFEAASKAVADQIGAFNDDQAADLARLNDAITKYGFSFEELGSKTQLDQINAQAKELIEDWRVLVGSGIDVSNVNTHMADTINDFLQTALKVGAEIPAAMRPILEQMAQQGVLTDAAGNKIDDLNAAGITFSETMTQGFDRIVAKLEELIAKIGGVGSAIDAIPSEKDIAINYSYNTPSAPTIPAPALNGYYAQMPGFKDGTEGKFLNFGAGTPVVLHGSERVVTAGEVTESSASMASMVGAMTSMQTSIIRAIRENALQMRDSSLIALGARS